MTASDPVTTAEELRGAGLRVTAVRVALGRVDAAVHNRAPLRARPPGYLRGLRGLVFGD